MQSIKIKYFNLMGMNTIGKKNAKLTFIIPTVTQNIAISF